MINRIVLVGRLTRDPELRNTKAGNTVCSFTVAVDNRQKNPDGTKGTTFVPCVVFNASADNTGKFTRKGSLVGVEGRLNHRSYTRNDGTKATVFEVICDSVQFLEPKGNGSITAGDENVEFDDTADVVANENLDSIDLPDDDLPF